MRRVSFTSFMKTHSGFPFYAAGDTIGDMMVETFSRLDRSGDPLCFYLDSLGIPIYQMIAYRDDDLRLRVCIVPIPPRKTNRPFLRAV
jgi:hypothetical protein